MEILIQIGFFLTLLLIGYIFGRRAERKHYKSIFKREAEYQDIVVTTERLPALQYANHQAQLVCGSVVISVDYFKVVLAGLKSIVGGRLTSYESLLDRARREALLRVQAQAEALGAKLVINLKFETSKVSGNASKGIGSMEVLAYGTALYDSESSTLEPNKLEGTNA